MAWNFTQGFKIQDINPNMNLSKKKKNIFSVVQLLVMVTKHMIESRNNS